MSTDWLGLAGKSVLVCGVANRKSVAWHVGARLEEAGANVLWAVHTEARRGELAPRLKGRVFVCDMTKDEDLARLADELAEHAPLAGALHSIAHADYSGGWKPFHETPRAAFLAAIDASAFSFVALANALRARLATDASLVTVSISSTRTAAENYGYMAPVKAALDSAVVFLAKSFSAFSQVRVNAVCAGPLKTSASAGIPGYVESYLFAEQLTLRKRALETREVADSALFLLSPRSSGINAQGLVVDAGMGVNAFERTVIERATRAEGG
ncbi:MAG: SDR family oxidoreductase [Planctomycetes bacterium]|nr:SDR family oxidoreductase [Planctomycetota bacterium]